MESRQLREKVFSEKVWVPSHSSFRYQEQVDAKGEYKYILSGLMLPFGKISRNNVLYNKESIIEKHKQLIGRPLMYNHLVEGDAMPRGHFIESVCLESAAPGFEFVCPGWYYKADVDPGETTMVRKLKRGDLHNVSIQLLGGRVVERMNGEGQRFVEAYVKDIIEGSVVVAPGFLDTTAKFAESLGLAASIEAVTTAHIERTKEAMVHVTAKLEAADFSEMAIPVIKQELMEQFGFSETDSHDLIEGVIGTLLKILGIWKGVDLAFGAKKEPKDAAKTEDMTTTSAGGAIGPALMAIKKKTKEMAKYEENLKLAEGIIAEVGEAEVQRMLQEKFLNVPSA